MKTENEFEHLGSIIRNEIQKDGKLTKYGTMLILYLGLALYVELPKLIIKTYLSKDK